MKDLNLIPKSYILARKKRTKRICIIITAIISSILIAGCIIIPLFLKYNLQKQIKDVNKKIEDTGVYQTTLQKVADITTKYSEREQIANSFAKYGVSAVTLLERIEKGVPEKLFITDLNIGSASQDEVKISLTGICATEDDAASFITHLREDNYYSNIIISSIKKNTVSSNSTSMTASIGKTNGDNVTGTDKTVGKIPNSTPSPGKKPAANNKNTVNVEKVQSTPAPITFFNFDISLYLKIKN